MRWRSSERSVRGSVRSVLFLAREHPFESVASPLLGRGTGGGDETRVQATTQDELRHLEYGGAAEILGSHEPENRTRGRTAADRHSMPPPRRGGRERALYWLVATMHPTSLPAIGVPGHFPSGEVESFASSKVKRGS